MSRRHCKVAVIGLGSAGLAAHAIARRHTDSLLLVDGGPFGTTCARNGCMPSKLLIAAADARHSVDQAALFGITVDDVRVDGQAVMARVQALRDRFVSGVLEVIDRLPEHQCIRAHAHFIEPYVLQVGEQQVHAERIVIATGSQPFVPPAFRSLGSRLLTSDTVFELPGLPESMAVIGGGVIGLELGQAMDRLGVRVRLFERGDRLGPRGDAAVSEVATRLLSASVPCEFNVTPEIRSADEQSVELAWRRPDGSEQSGRFERVLVATGRRPALQSLQLEHSGLALDARGVPLFDPTTLRCGDSRVFMAGDANAMHPVLHEAAEEGRIAGENAARFPEYRAHRRRTPLQIAFTDPQFATVGVQPGTPGATTLAAGQVSFDDQGRSRVIGRNAGIGRIYGDPDTGKVVGGQLVGPAAEHLAHLLAAIVQHELTVEQAVELPFYHPVIEEGLRTALRDLRRTMHRGTGPQSDCLECGPGT